MKKNIFLISFIFFFCSYTAQLQNDCCKEDSKRLLNMFNRYKNKYVEVIKINLQSSYEKDSNFRMIYEKMDKIDLDSFEYRINPIMKWAKGARDYGNSKDNICNYFDIDTIFYSCEAALFKDSIMHFYCFMGNLRNIMMPGNDKGTPALKFNFIGFYNLNQEMIRSNCDTIISIPYNYLDKLFTKDYELRFKVDGLGRSFLIKENKLFMIPYDDRFEVDSYFQECPQEYVRRSYKDKTIHRFTLLAPSYKIPWWQFWNWEIFH